MTVHVPSPNIFRAYDIRGIYGETLFDADAYHIGYQFGVLLQKENETPEIVVGYDGRASSPALYEALKEGLMDAGVHVVCVGQVPTPALYFAEYTLKGIAGGIMITGSHNPPHHNGFKIVKGHAPFFGSHIKSLSLPLERRAFKEGAARTHPILEAYLTRILEEAVSLKPLKVIWDTGNGVVGPFLKELTKKLPGQHIIINEAVDATFPSHQPDPSHKENLLELQKKVLFEGADIGIAFDGDGDRMGAVTKKGDFWMSESLLFIFAEDVLKTHPQGTLIADVKVTDTFFEYVTSKGGKALMVPTGHSLIKSTMKETQSPFAGEYSGHMFFADRYYGFDDGLYAALRLLKILSAEGYESLLKIVPTFYKTPEFSLAVRSLNHKEKIMSTLKEKLFKEKKAFDDRDGIRVTTPDGWWLVRPSNTEDKIVFMGEGHSELASAAVLKTLEALMEEASHL